MKALQSAKNNFFKDTVKEKQKEKQKTANKNKSRVDDNKKAKGSKDIKHYSRDTEKTEFVYTTEIISQESELKYVEHDDNFSQQRTFLADNSENLDFDNANDIMNEEFFVSDTKGDARDEKMKERLGDLIEENKRIMQINNVQKNQIDKLLTENESVKEINVTLISKNEVNTQYLSRIIDVLQQKISELNVRLQTHEMDSIDKEKSIKQLLEVMQGIPKKLHNAIYQDGKRNLNADSNMTELTSSLQKEHSTSFPMLKINYKVSPSKHSIKVVCRVKPDIDNCLRVPTSDMIYLPPFKHFEQGLGYRLHKVFGASASQLEVFEEINPILPSCFTGCNVCVITYGQSGSGKTHTMIGNSNEPGLMLLSMQELFKVKNENVQTIFKFYLTILEIYNENIYDLMSSVGDRNSMNLKARVFLQDNGHSVQVKDVSEAEINKEIEFAYYINQSLKRRSSSVTVKNMSSSRSHYLVMIRVAGMSKTTGIATNRGSLIMCDLAGSENCIGLSNQEQTESKYINKSITMLNRVFDSMYRKSATIPFRDSKLTHLLKPSLMGNAKCVFIATVCSQPDQINDTYRTLNVAKKVEMIHFNEKEDIQ